LEEVQCQFDLQTTKVLFSSSSTAAIAATSGRRHISQSISMDSELKSVIDKPLIFPVDKNDVATHLAE
jgi:hypothetical protein